MAEEKEIKKIYFCQKCWQAWPLEAGSKCPECGIEREAVPWFYGNLIKTKGAQTGPKTEDGRKQAILNLRLHNAGPGAEASKHTRLNGVTHGRYLVASPLYPAKRDQYPECKDCQLYAQCGEEGYKYCPNKTDKLYEFQSKVLAAIKNNDLGALDEYAALNLAKTHAILEDMLEGVFKYGTMYEEMRLGSDGKELGARLTANPMLEILPKFLDRLGFTAQERKLTQKTKEETAPEVIMEMVKALLGNAPRLTAKDDDVSIEIDDK